MSSPTHGLPAIGMFFSNSETCPATSLARRLKAKHHWQVTPLVKIHPSLEGLQRVSSSSCTFNNRLLASTNPMNFAATSHDLEHDDWPIGNAPKGSC